MGYKKHQLQPADNYKLDMKNTPSISFKATQFCQFSTLEIDNIHSGFLITGCKHSFNSLQII